MFFCVFFWTIEGAVSEDTNLVGEETCWCQKNEISWRIAAEIINRNYVQIIFTLPCGNMDAQKQE
jgi:hypothetical protein